MQPSQSQRQPIIAIMLAIEEILAHNLPAESNDYRALLEAFQSTSATMKACSASFNALLVELPAGLPQDERSSRIAAAAAAYEDARGEFLAAAARLHEFTISQIVSSHPQIQLSATQS